MIAWPPKHSVDPQWPANLWCNLLKTALGTMVRLLLQREKNHPNRLLVFYHLSPLFPWFLPPRLLTLFQKETQMYSEINSFSVLCKISFCVFVYMYVYPSAASLKTSVSQSSHSFSWLYQCFPSKAFSYWRATATFSLNPFNNYLKLLNNFEPFLGWMSWNPPSVQKTKTRSMNFDNSITPSC